MTAGKTIRAAQLYREGWSLSELERLFVRNREEIRKVLIAHGVTMRTARAGHEAYYDRRRKPAERISE